MINSFRHEGLKRFCDKGSTKGIDSSHAEKLRRILAALDAAEAPTDLNLPSFRLHALQGERRGEWSIWVNGNWRIVFSFDETNVGQVDYIDYH